MASLLFLVALSVIYIFLGLSVYLRKRNGKINIIFGIFAASTLFWLLSNYLENEHLGFAIRKLFLGLDFASACLAAYFFLSFCRNFPKIKSQNKVDFLLFLPLLPLMGLSFSIYIIKDVKIINDTIIFTPAILFTPYSLILSSYFIGGSLQLFLKLKIAKKIERAKIIYVLMGMFISSSIILILNLVLPQIFFLPKYIARIGIYGLVFFIGFTAYAIVKHRLLDIRLLVLKSVAYSITIFVIATAYVTIFYLGINKLIQAKLINPILLNIFALLILAFSFEPLKRFISKHTDRIFAKNIYNFNELLGIVGELTKQNSRSITGLTTKVMETLTKEMRIKKAAFILTNSPEPAQIRTVGFESKSKHLWSKPTKMAFESGQTIVYDELEEDNKSKEIMRTVGAEVLIPIKTEQETEGILALGEKSSGDMYTAQDLNLLELVAPQIALALENAKSFKEKEQRIAELKSINKMFRHIEHFLDLDNLLQKIVDEAILVTGAEGGSVMLINKTATSLSIKTARSLSPVISLNAKIKIGEGIAGKVALTRKPLILNGFRDNRFKDHLKREDIVSAISVPMMAGDQLIGVLNVNRKKLRVEFTKENLNVMGAFAAQAAEAISKAGYYHQIEKLSIKNDNQFKEFTKALAKTVDAKDPYTYGHSEAVTNYAIEIAKEMGVSKQQMRTLEIGGRLHDMGKIGVPEHILNKPAGLTDEEYKAIQRHPEIGARILKDTSSLKSIRDLILYHHERFDGRGYPANLNGKDIPMLARILAVADTYDAMTSHRAYRKALPRRVAVEEIQKNSGSQFDPDVVKAFSRVMDKKRFRVIKNTIQQTAYLDEVKFGLDETAE